MKNYQFIKNAFAFASLIVLVYIVSTAVIRHLPYMVFRKNTIQGCVYYDTMTIGDSTKEYLGKAFVFTYSMDFLILLHNELFTTDDGKLQLLAASDGTNTHIYISLEAVRNYMTKDGYFTDFSDDGSRVWRFGGLKSENQSYTYFR